MLEQLKEKVCRANLSLVEQGLVTQTWGNASGIDRATGYVVIKPSGVSYEGMEPHHMVVVDLSGNVIEGSLHPSTDTPTHLELYKTFNKIGGIVHTHSLYATSWAQAGRDIPAYGTTHADYFNGDIPCARDLTEEETKGEYEKNTGTVIIHSIVERRINMDDMPGVLCKHHGVFTWGEDVDKAVYHAAVIEQVAKMAALTELLNNRATPVPDYVLKKHYERKHGKHAYYGQD